MNIAASPCTRAIGLSGSNHRGPGVPWIRWACAAPSGPATRRNSCWPSLSRTALTPRQYVGPQRSSCGRTPSTWLLLRVLAGSDPGSSRVPGPEPDGVLGLGELGEGVGGQRVERVGHDVPLLAARGEVLPGDVRAGVGQHAVHAGEHARDVDVQEADPV